MNTLSDLAGGTGVVTIPGEAGAVREFLIAPLSLDDEETMYRFLEGQAEARTRAKRQDFLADLSAAKSPGWAHAAAIKAMVELADAPPSDAAVDRQRDTIEGTAVELWCRSRAAHPGLALDEVKAIVTTANVGSIRRQLKTILRGVRPAADGDSKSPSADAAGSA